MLGDLLEVISQILNLNTNVAGKPSGPPIDLGGGLAILGGCIAVAGMILFFSSHLHPIVIVTMITVGILTSFVGVQRHWLK